MRGIFSQAAMFTVSLVFCLSLLAVPELRAASTGARLKAMGYQLPPTPTPEGNYVSARKEGNLVFVSAQFPVDAKGIMTAECTQSPSSAKLNQAAANAALNALAAAAAAVGGLSQLKGVVQLDINVACGKNMDDLADKASRIMVRTFGQDGRHTRTVKQVQGLSSDASISIGGVFLAR